MNIKPINAQPNPEFLIKSISEQGYTLETALSDLIDNSITAESNKIEILTESIDGFISVFISDNGCGMSSEQLMDNMQFPSNDMEKVRNDNDLGRFGLGMKTASFSQTRKFTVLSRTLESDEFSALRWDVGHLRKTGRWEIIAVTEKEKKDIRSRYFKASENHLAHFENFRPSTIIVWEGLKNFDKIKDPLKRTDFLSEQLTDTTSEHLSIVFHKFMEKPSEPLKIRLNNKLIKSFNPFRSSEGEESRALEQRDLPLRNDILRIQGHVLPVSAVDNQRSWSTQNKNLLDMEGLYIYRGNRLIYFGGWNGIIRKQRKLNLARLKIQVGNIDDDALQLNVSKSKITIPHELRMGVLRYINFLKQEAEKEYNNRGLRRAVKRNNENRHDLLSKQSTTKGPVYSVNEEYPVVKLVMEGMKKEQLKYFRTFLRKINLLINKQRYSEEGFSLLSASEEDWSDIIETAEKLKNTGLSSSLIFELLTNDSGYDKNLLSEKLKNILNL